MHKLIIRDMQEDDIPAIVEIEQISFSTPWSRQSFLNEMYKKMHFQKLRYLRKMLSDTSV